MEAAASADRAKRMPEERRRREAESENRSERVRREMPEESSPACVRREASEEERLQRTRRDAAEESRSERPRRTSADGSRAERERQAVAESRRTERERAVSAKESRLQRDYTPASAHRAAKENAGMRARRFKCARHPARSFTTRWNGRNTVIAQRDMSRNQSDPDAPARQKPG